MSLRGPRVLAPGSVATAGTRLGRIGALASASGLLIIVLGPAGGTAGATMVTTAHRAAPTGRGWPMLLLSIGLPDDGPGMLDDKSQSTVMDAPDDDHTVGLHAVDGLLTKAPVDIGTQLIILCD